MRKSCLNSAEFCPFDLTFIENMYFKNTVGQIKLSSVKAGMWNTRLVKKELDLIM